MNFYFGILIKVCGTSICFKEIFVMEILDLIKAYIPVLGFFNLHFVFMLYSLELLL